MIYGHKKMTRLETLEATYNKADLDDVSGYTGLLTIISSTTTDEKAVYILNELLALVSPHSHYDGYSSDELGGKRSQSKQLIEITESRVDLFFID